MIKVTSKLSNTVKTFNCMKFIEEFNKWNDIQKKVFLNRTKEGNTFEFELSLYEFDKKEYKEFKQQLGIV